MIKDAGSVPGEGGGDGTDGTAKGYRYGFNGKENDNEVKGEGNQQDYGMRVYDPRIAKFLSVDPLTKKYPELTPYQFASNRPIDGIDIDGLEWGKKTDEKGNTQISVNVSFDNSDGIIPKGQVKTYQNALNDALNETLKLSTNGRVSGSVTFNGGESSNAVVPRLSVYASAGDMLGGQTTLNMASINMLKRDGSMKSPEEFGRDAVHELFHTLRVEHPFERTQSLDSKLTKAFPGFKFLRNYYMTTPQTDKKGVYYNIMNYHDKIIDGKKLGNLWKSTSPVKLILTEGQVKFILSEIGLQMMGRGKNMSDPYWAPSNAPGKPVE